MIELLVVVSIVSTLAAIAVPSFSGQRGKAQDTAAKEYVRTAAVALETFATESGTYNATTVQLRDLEPSLNEARNLQVTGTVNTYTISVDSVPGDNGGTFSMDRAANG